MKAITYGNLSDIGKARGENQDFFGKFPEDSLNLPTPKGQLFIIADGMGGHKAGREASELAVNVFAYYYFSAPTDNISESLLRAFRGANEHIHSYSVNSPQYSGMGTTCSALAIKDEFAYIGHIGDSRVYRITKHKIEQLTKDHSKVAEMMRRGILTKEEAKAHPERSHLYQALGIRQVVEPDFISEIPLKANESFLMCTDGLYNHVEDQEMYNIVLSYSPTMACSELVNLANSRGGLDNITVQVIGIHNTESIIDKIIQ